MRKPALDVLVCHNLFEMRQEDRKTPLISKRKTIDAGSLTIPHCGNQLQQLKIKIEEQKKQQQPTRQIYSTFFFIAQLCFVSFFTSFSFVYGILLFYVFL